MPSAWTAMASLVLTGPGAILIGTALDELERSGFIDSVYGAVK